MSDSAKSLLGNVKEAAALADKDGNIALREKLLDFREQIMDLEQKNLDLKQENDRLKAELRQKDEMAFKKPFYFKEGDATPYCGTCWEGKRLPVHLVECETGGTYICHHCKNVFSDGREDEAESRF